MNWIVVFSALAPAPADPDIPRGYQEAYQRAVDRGVSLVVYVKCKPRQLPDVIEYECDRLPGVSGRGVMVGRHSDDPLGYTRYDLESGVADETIMAKAGVISFDEANRRLNAKLQKLANDIRQPAQPAYVQPTPIYYSSPVASPVRFSSAICGPSG